MYLKIYKKNILTSGGVSATAGIGTAGDISTWRDNMGFTATNSSMDVRGGPKNLRTAIGLGIIDNTTWGGDWAPQDLTINAKKINMPEINAKNIISSGGVSATAGIGTAGDISTWRDNMGFTATNSTMDVRGGPKNLRTAIGFGTIDNTTWGGDWAPQDLTINAKNIITKCGITSQPPVVTPQNSTFTELTSYINAGCGGHFSYNLPNGTTKKIIFKGQSGSWTVGDITYISDKFWTGTFSGQAGGGSLWGAFTV